jgi:hypothetical protein
VGVLVEEAAVLVGPDVGHPRAQLVRRVPVGVERRGRVGEGGSGRGSRRRGRGGGGAPGQLGLGRVEPVAVAGAGARDEAVARRGVEGAGAVRAVAERDAREHHGSLMVLGRAVGVVRLRGHVVDARVAAARVVVAPGRPVVVRVVRLTVVVVVLLLGLALAVLLVLHAPVLEPDLHLALGQVQVARELPALLLRDVGVEEELLLELERLELGVGLALLADGHLAGPLQGIRASDPHAGDPDAHAHAQGTCRKQGRWGGTPHHLTQLVGL